jgi:hypothetical protein
LSSSETRRRSAAVSSGSQGRSERCAEYPAHHPVNHLLFIT